MKEWNIGDKVRTLRMDEIPQERKATRSTYGPNVWATSKYRLAGAVGEIVDKMYSEAYGEHLYKLHIDGARRASTSLFVSDDLREVEPEKVDFRVEFEYLDRVVVARAMSGDRQLGIGHGHLLHGGGARPDAGGELRREALLHEHGRQVPEEGGRMRWR